MSKPMETPPDGGSDIVKYLYNILGQVVILPIPKGEKGPKFTGWNNTTWEDTQKPTYQQWIRGAVERGGNLGILLGPSSGGLVAIDFDDDDEIELFYETCPWARGTMKTHGRHYQVWLIMDGEYPMERKILKKVEGKPTVEFRGGGGIQSVVWGLHPQGMRYSVEGTPIHTSYAALADWIAVMEGFKPGYGDPRKHDYSQLGKYKGLDIQNLDLLGLLQEAEIYPKQVEKEAYAIRCPWVSEHTTKSGVRDAAVWQYPVGTRFPAFRCLHAHCVDRWLLDLLDWMEGEYPGIVARHCRKPGRKRGLPGIIEYSKGFEDKPTMPEVLIDGILHKGCKMMIAGPSKLGKTWLGIDLALALSRGDMWLDFDTCQSRILYLNMEMQRQFFELRMWYIQQSRGIDSMPDGAFNVLHMRGCRELDAGLDPLLEVCHRQGPFDVIIIDPLYKILGERDENSASDVADLLGEVDKIVEQGSAVVTIHHFAKGDANMRDVGDRASGSGVFFRDPDAFITMTPLNRDTAYEAKMAFRLRGVEWVEPFGVRWDNYIWRRDPGLDDKVKTYKGGVSEGKPPKPTQSDILLGILAENPDGLTHAEWKKIAEVTFSIGPSSFNYALKNLEKQRKIILDSNRKYKIGPVQSN